MAEEAIIINDSGRSLYGGLDRIRELQAEHGYLVISVKRVGAQRTDKQRAAIEVFCRELAKALNDAGFDQRKVLAAMKEGVEIPNSQESVKELWREIQKALGLPESTAKLETPQVSRVYEVMNRWTAQTFGISMEFPHEDRV